MAMSPEMQKKLQAEREQMTQEERQTAALERIADLMSNVNAKLVAIELNTRKGGSILGR